MPWLRLAIILEPVLALALTFNRDAVIVPLPVTSLLPPPAELPDPDELPPDWLTWT